MQFKSDQQEREFESLANRDGALIPVMVYTDWLSQWLTGQEIVVTSIYRTRLQQAAICAQVGREYRSPHEYWRAFDCRSRIYTAEQVQVLSLGVGAVFAYPGRYDVLALHGVGTAVHLHGQIPAGEIWTMQR